MKISKKFTSIFLAGLLSASVAFSTPAVFATGDPDNPVDFKWDIDINKASISPIPAQTYTGSSIKPDVTIKYKGTILKQNTDYTLTYSNNTKIGKASITIKGIKNYKGSKTIQFKISPQEVKNLKATPTTTYINLSWSKTPGISNYAVYRATSQNGKYTRVKTLSSSASSYKDTKASKEKVYYYKVRAYKTVNKTKYYGAYSNVICSAKTPSKPVITVKNAGSKTVKVSWKKVSGANGYEVYRKSGSSAKYSIVQTVTSGNTLSYTNKKLIKNSKYYYKVRAYRIVNGEKIYSSFSTVKQIKCK